MKVRTLPAWQTFFSPSALAANHIEVIKDTHGKTSHLSAADLDALIAYLKSLDRETRGAITASAP